MEAIIIQDRNWYVIVNSMPYTYSLEKRKHRTLPSTWMLLCLMLDKYCSTLYHRHQGIVISQTIDVILKQRGLI